MSPDYSLIMDYGTIDFDYAGYLASQPEEDDGPIWMVNYMRYKKLASYDDGAGQVSGKEADDRYAPTEVLAAIGAEVAFFGDVIAGDGTWDRVAIVRYPTRKSFIDMQSRDDFKEKKVHKDAGMDFTIIMCSLPQGPKTGEGDGTRTVQFISFPSGSDTPSALPNSVTFSVEGTIIGDDRRWDHLQMVFSDDVIDDLPEGTMVVRSQSKLDRVAELI